MKWIMAALTGLLNRRRLMYLGAATAMGLLAFFGYSSFQSWWSPTADLPLTLQATASPAAILAGMTDDELRWFANSQQLPESLRSDDWVRVKVIQNALNEKLAVELVKRWQRDAAGATISTAYNASAAQQIAAAHPVVNTASPLDVSRPGVLGVQVVPQGSGLQVVYIHPQSAAWRSGMRVGDHVLSINGRRVLSPDDLVQQLGFAAGAGGQAQVEFVRGYTRQIATADVSGGAAHIASNWRSRF